jgi:RNA polymerase sigma factor (sigma-70 family)
MKSRPVRSKGMSELAAATAEAGTDLSEGFERLYRSNRDDVYAYVASLLGDRAAAEDVTATTFERAYRKRSSYRPRRGPARAWLFGIARNAALDELRRRQRTAALETDVVDEAAPTQIESAESALRRTSVRGALGALDPRERELVALKFYGGLSNGEIASVLGISDTNTATMLHRTITKLRKACDETAA